jgi:hypothetical protein
MANSLKQIALTCSGCVSKSKFSEKNNLQNFLLIFSLSHTRPVVHLDFSDITDCGTSFLISACKGKHEKFPDKNVDQKSKLRKLTRENKFLFRGHYTLFFSPQLP